MKAVEDCVPVVDLSMVDNSDVNFVNKVIQLSATIAFFCVQ